MASPTDPDNARSHSPIAVAPVLMTLGNMICGFLAVFYASRSEVGGVGPYSPIDIAAGLIFVGMILDAFDGAVARATNSVSRFGAQLDSMADMVTFGVAPAFLMLQLNQIQTPFFADMPHDTYFDRGILLIAVAYVACAGLRLARFNVAATSKDPDEHGTRFDGLPSPGAAGAVASLTLLSISISSYIDPYFNTRFAQWVTVSTAIITLGLAVLMVSPLEYPHVFARYLRGRKPFHYLGLGVIVAILLATVPQYAAVVGFLIYCFSGPVAWLFSLHFNNKLEDDDNETPDSTAPESNVESVAHRLN